MWVANFEDGTSESSKNCFWTQLREKANGKKLAAVQLTHPHYPSLHLCLSDMDKFYFVTEAVQTFAAESGLGAPTVVAEMIGGHNSELGIGVEMRLDYKGSVRTRVYKLSNYKYTPDILVDGARG